MASGTNYSQEYAQAEKEYLQGNLTQAADIIDNLVSEFPDNPNVLLLRGHIYYGFQNYETAQQQYETVLSLSEDQDLLDLAAKGIEQIEQLQQQFEASGLDHDQSESEEWEDFDFTEGVEELIVDEIGDSSSNDQGRQSTASADFSRQGTVDHNLASEDEFDNPFSLEEDDLDSNHAYDSDPFAQLDSLEEEDLSEPSNEDESFETAIDDDNVNNHNNGKAVYSSPTFMVDSDEEEDLLSESFDENIDNNSFAEGNYQENNNFSEFENNSDFEIDTVLTESYSIENSGSFNISDSSGQDGLDYQDELDFDEIDSSFFDLEELEQGLPDTGLFNVAEDFSPADSEGSSMADAEPESDLLSVDDIESDEQNSADQVLESDILEPAVETQPGFFGSLANSPMGQKQFTTACVTGVVSAIAVLGFGIAGVGFLTKEAEGNNNWFLAAKAGALMSVVAGASSFVTSMSLGKVITKQVEKSTRNLQSQFEDVYQGNLNAKATVYSQDELGRLASGFNRMTRVILTTTQEAQRRAEETEQAKEDLQRQVIRLLDDVEGAARGDLTVQATVTADVLGAVADAFNLTIQSLREIVRQVKQAAEQVNKSSTDSELFARNQSSEALRMAEELAVTLNSVQMMTESIERVAENAREAEEVARSSSVTALKGGKAVESTVSGIFQIRETVSETARKVKRLAEASQEISKIVLLISQIAERTNQLALNASIQAAKAGEAGRGFAIVADEVRQLADRSGKSLKEIEQIVLQIQSETGSVMTAMEEGIQEVIDVTDRAEQAKTALEDIIQVSNRIDTLVRSITADTVEQRENSRAVAQVMQSVELTAQATSQESQRVAGSLQSLVSIARDLLSSVERFRIDKSEE
ncbi:MAG: methyl-accepting chemotaxis protein [Xenococcaceae cyanobacterium MO_188.B19]|nr:methyl-accepting chemotaxis protein [Xenococcaceae cyanobacterium MO_188.B19]